MCIQPVQTWFFQKLMEKIRLYYVQSNYSIIRHTVLNYLFCTSSLTLSSNLYVTLMYTLLTFAIKFINNFFFNFYMYYMLTLVIEIVIIIYYFV